MTGSTIGQPSPIAADNIIQNNTLDISSKSGDLSGPNRATDMSARIDFAEVYANRTQPTPLSERATTQLREISDFGRENQKIEDPSVQGNPVQVLGGASPRGSAQQMPAEPVEDYYKFSTIASSYLKASRYNQELAFVGSVGGNMTKSIKTLMTSQ